MRTPKHVARKATFKTKPTRPTAATKGAAATLAEPPQSAPSDAGASPGHGDSGGSDTQPAQPQAAPSLAPLAPNPSLIPEGPFVPFATRALGASYGAYPTFMDEIMDRSLVRAAVVTGTGNQVITLTAPPLAVHASIVGIDTFASPKQVTTSLNSDGNVIVNGSDGVTWSVLVLTQAGNV